MFKHFLLYSIIAAFSYAAFAQCPPFDVHTGFTTQEQIDEFIANYPNCTVLNTNVLIGKIVVLKTLLKLTATCIFGVPEI